MAKTKRVPFLKHGV